MWYPTLNGEHVRYWDLPDKQIANNSRAGSVSVYFAIVARFNECRTISGKPTKPVLALIRDPFERYRSALAKGVDDPQWGNHFGVQSSFLPARCYRFPGHLEQFSRDTGLEVSHINPSANKPELTSEQRQYVKEHYADDIALYESLTEPGHRT